MKPIVLDFETISACDLKKSGAWRYSEDPSTEILCLCFEDLNTKEVLTWTPTLERDHSVNRRLLELLHNSKILFVAHMVGFEKAIWRNIMTPLYGFPDILNERWHDTMAVAAMKQMPQDLDTLCSVLDLEVREDMEGSRLVRGMSQYNKKGNRKVPMTPENLERVYSYCRTDVGAERSLLNRLGNFQRGERDVWLLDQTINERGIMLDLPYIKACQKIVDGATVPLAAEFREITRLNFGQTVKIGEWCRGEKVFIPNLQKDTVAEILGHDIDSDDGEDRAGTEGDYCLPEHVRRALEIRQLVGSASVKKLSRMRSCIGHDRRARGLLQYHGAGPGRWAGRIIQPHNFPRPSLKDENSDPISVDLIVDTLMTGDHEYVSAVLGPPVEVVVSGLRHALITEPGKLFVSGDYRTIEARIVLALAGQSDKIKVLADGRDIYIDMAQEIYHRAIDKKKDPKERQTGKNSVLGLGFQMGWKKFHSRYCKDQPEEFAKSVVDVYRNEWAPEVPKLWHALETAALRTVCDKTPHEAYGVRYALEDGWMTARLPSGRKLYYYRPTPCRKVMPWSTKEDQDIRMAWYYLALKQGVVKRVDAFGGHLTENVVQGLARDLLVHSMFGLEAENLPLILTVHDEDLIEVEEYRADEKLVAEIMRDRPQWAIDLNLPVSVETWIGMRYRK